MRDKLYPGQSRIETPEEAGHSPVQEETASTLWKGLDSSEKKGPEARRDHRNAAAKAALPTPEAEPPLYDWDAASTMMEESGMKTPWEIRQSGGMSPDDAWADSLEEDASKFLDTYDHDRINQVAVGQEWKESDRDAAHGYLDKLKKQDPGDWQLIEQTDGGELIFQDFDTQQKVSVEQSSGTHRWHSPEDDEKKE